MPIKFRCAACQTAVTAPDAAAGRTLRCPACRTGVTVPTTAVPPIPMPPAPRTGRRVWPWVLAGGIGCVGLTGVAAGLVAAIVVGWTSSKERAHEKEKAASTDAVSLASHPWWQGSVNEGRVEEIVAAVARLQSEHERTPGGAALVIRPDGAYIRIPDDDTGKTGETRPFGSLNTRNIIVYAGPRNRSKHLSRDDARALLRDMLDRGHNHPDEDIYNQLMNAGASARRKN